MNAPYYREGGVALDGLNQYGPWAIAFGLVLLAFKEVVLQVVKGHQTPPPTRDLGGAFADLAKAVDKLSAVLDRIEKTQDKALAEIQSYQRDMLRLLTEIRTAQKQGGPD